LIVDENVGLIAPFSDSKIEVLSGQVDPILVTEDVVENARTKADEPALRADGDAKRASNTILWIFLF